MLGAGSGAAGASAGCGGGGCCSDGSAATAASSRSTSCGVSVHSVRVLPSETRTVQSTLGALARAPAPRALMFELALGAGTSACASQVRLVLLSALCHGLGRTHVLLEARRDEAPFLQLLLQLRHFQRLDVDHGVDGARGRGG